MDRPTRTCERSVMAFCIKTMVRHCAFGRQTANQVDTARILRFERYSRSFRYATVPEDRVGALSVGWDGSADPGGSLPLREFDQNRIRGWLCRAWDALGWLSGHRPDQG